MKLVRFAERKLGVALGDNDRTLLDVGASLDAFARTDADKAAALREALPDDGTWIELIERWDVAGPALSAMVDRAQAGADGFVTAALADAALAPPMAGPAVRIFALGGNFPAHLVDAQKGMTKEMPASISKPKDEQVPWGFTMLPGTFTTTDTDVTPPRSVQKLDYEAEVAVILRGPVEAGQPDSARVWAYAAVNDFSIRDHVLGLSMEDHGPMQFGLTKNFKTGNAFGPWLVVVDDDAAVGDLTIEGRVNGELRQRASTSEMMWSFQEVAAHVAQYLPLGAGDMIVSGTPGGTAVERGPDGPFLQDGDVTEVEVTGAGIVRNRVVFSK